MTWIVMAAGLLAIGGAWPVHAEQPAGQAAQACPHAQQWIAAYQKRMRAMVKPLAAIKPSDAPLADELARRAAADQAVRHTVIADGAKPSHADMQHWLDVDKANLHWLRQQVDAHGFPTLAQVGLNGIHDAWLLTQHADRDPALQARVLAALKPRLAQEPFLRAEYALLTDRVRLARHHKQIDGSQFVNKHGHMVLSPLAAPAHLDARRARMNLMPMADYRCELQAMYGPPKNKHGSNRASSPEG